VVTTRSRFIVVSSRLAMVVVRSNQERSRGAEEARTKIDPRKAHSLTEMDGLPWDDT
jgi:hypothetical protein